MPKSTVLVRCISGCGDLSTVVAASREPRDSKAALAFSGSILPIHAASGGNSMIRETTPFGGGWIDRGRCVGSPVASIAAGLEKVAQISFIEYPGLSGA